MCWIEKCEILLQPEVNTTNIMKVLGKGHEYSRKLRQEIVIHYKDKGIIFEDVHRIPTDLFLEYIGKPYSYFETKARQQSRLQKMKGEMNE